MVKYTINVLHGRKDCQIVCYADDHKYDIDLGAFVSNRLDVLNLDTFEEIIVEV